MIKNSKKGFTVIELVIAIAILAIVSSVSVGILFNIQNNFSTSNTLSTRQYNASFTQDILSAYIKTAEDIVFTEKTSTSNFAPTSENDAVILIETGDNSSPAICLKKAVKTSTGYTYKKIYELDNGKNGSTIKDAQIDKIVFNLVENVAGTNISYKLNYKISSGTYMLESGTSILNMKEYTRTRPTDFTLNINDTSTYNNAIKITAAADPTI